MRRGPVADPLPGAIDRPRTDRLFLSALLGVTLLLGIAFNLLTPAFLGPDERGHMEYVWSLWESGGARVQAVEGHQPPAYYWLALVGYGPVAAEPIEVRVATTRLVSVALLLGEVVLAYLVARMLSPANPFVYLLTPALVALLPGRAWIGSTVNNDNLVGLVSAALLYLLLRGILRGFDRRLLAGTLALLPLAVLTKTTAWPMVALVVVGLVATAVARLWRMGTPGRWIVPGLVGASGVALLLALPLVWRRLAAVAEPGRALSLAIPAPRPEPFLLQIKSFWFPIWADDYGPPELAFRVAVALTLVALAGLLLGLRSAWLRRRSGQVDRRWVACVAVMGLAAAATWTVPIVRYVIVVTGSDSFIAPRVALWLMHGRFLYPALVPIAYLMALGFDRLVPSRLRGAGVAALVSLLLLLDGFALYSVFSRVYWWAS